MKSTPVGAIGPVLVVAAGVALAACQSLSISSPPAAPSSAARIPASAAVATPAGETRSPAWSASPTSRVSAPPTPRPTSIATEAPAPSKPTGVTFTSESVARPAHSGTDEVDDEVTHTVRWKAPRGDDVEIRVYGVTECLAEPSNPPPGSVGPCLVEHTLLPRSTMALAATAPAAAGVISWVAPFSYECAGPPVGPDGLDYHAVVVAAYNAAGHSTFAIAYPGAWWRAAPDEAIC